MSLKTSRGERKKKLFSFGKKNKKKEDTKELLKTVESVEKEGDVTAPTEIEGRVQSWKPFEAEDFKNWENEEEKNGKTYITVATGLCIFKATVSGERNL